MIRTRRRLEMDLSTWQGDDRNLKIVCYSYVVVMIKLIREIYMSWKIARMSGKSLVKCTSSCFCTLWKLCKLFGCKCRSWEAIIWLWSLSLLSWGRQKTSVGIYHWKNNNHLCYVKSILYSIFVITQRNASVKT